MPIPIDEAPFIVTAHLEPACFAALDALRRAHFPILLNRIPAHISLFHQLPGEHGDRIGAALAACAAQRKAFDLPAGKPLLLGRGVAIRYEAPELSRLHADLARTFAPWLSAQDRQAFRAHVTIQNKVAPPEARALYAKMQMTKAPDARVEGLDLWRYRGGPWDAVATFRFPS